MMTRKSKSRHITVYVALVLLIAAGAGGWWYSKGGGFGIGIIGGGTPAGGPGQTAKAPAAKPAGGPPAGFAMPVEAVTVKVDAARREALAIGTLRSFESVVIRPEVAGRIGEILFVEGKKVKKGEPLIRLDAAVEKATLAQAQSRRDLAKLNFDRAQSLVARNAGTVKALDEARSALQTAQSEIDLAQARLEKLEIVEIGRAHV